MADFVKLNGYNVKDSESRTEAIKNKKISTITNLEICLDKFYNVDFFNSIVGEQGYQLQSSICLPNNNFLIAVINENDHNLGKLIEINPLNFNVINRYTLNIGHANDMAIVGNNLYIASGGLSDGDNGGYILQVSLLTYQIINKINFNTYNQFWLISYDDIKDKLYIATGSQLLIVSPETMLIDSVIDNGLIIQSNYGHMIRQSSFIYQNILFVLTFTITSSTQWNPKFAHFLSGYDIDNNFELLATKTFYNDYAYIEMQDIIKSNDGKLVGFGFGKAFTTYQIINSLEMGAYNPNKALVGERIFANSDLNNYKKYGKYAVWLASDARNIENSPYNNGAYEMEIKGVNGGSLVQSVRTSAGLRGQIAERICNVDDDSFTSWNYNIISQQQNFGILRGSTSETRIDGNSYTDIVVLLPKRLNNISVFVEMFSGTESLDVGDIQHIISNRQNTQFTIRVINKSSNNRWITFHWLAIGEILD